MVYVCGAAARNTLQAPSAEGPYPSRVAARPGGRAGASAPAVDAQAEACALRRSGLKPEPHPNLTHDPRNADVVAVLAKSDTVPSLHEHARS